jgi:MoaD family protein
MRFPCLQVSVRFFTVLREVTGKKEDALHFVHNEKVTVDTVLRTLSDRYGKPFSEYVFDPKTGTVKGFLQFFVNGQSTSAQHGLGSEMHDGDLLAIVPPIGGG